MTPLERPQSAAEARAEAEARHAEQRAERRAAFDAAYGPTAPGRPVVVVSWVITAAFALAAAAALLWPERFDAAFLILSLVLFAAGCALFLVDLVLAANRSRSDEMGIGGLFFLVGSAPPDVQRNLNGSLGAQVAVALAAAAVGFVRLGDRDLNAAAFGILVPTIALGLNGLWGVRWGLFPARADDVT